MPKYFQSEAQLVTTQCIILEAETLGAKVQGATNIVKQFRVHKCGHEKGPKSATACIKTMVKNNRYIVASQDRGLQDRLRERPGQPILYLHKKTPVLEQPSELSRKTVEFKMTAAVTFGQSDVNKLTVLKKAQGLATADDQTNQVKKKFKKKQPNPLSCKKKKNKKTGESSSQQQHPIVGVRENTMDKKKRKRVHISKHVKEMLKEKPL